MYQNNTAFSKEKYIAEVKAFCERKYEGKERRVLESGNIIYFPGTEQDWQPRQR